MAVAGSRPPPNYDDRGGEVVAYATVLIVVPTITVLLRLWSRAVASRAQFWWDDFMLLATLACSHVYLALVFWSVALGLGKHIWMVPLSNLKPTLLASHLQITFYATSLLLMRLSALTLYARIFRASKSSRRSFWALGALITAFWVVTVVVPWTNCQPLAKVLDPAVPGTCDARISWYIAGGVIDFVLDLIILLAPMPMVWKLNLKWKKKMLLSIILLLGYASAFLTLARLILVARNPSVLSLAPGSDPSWDTVPLLFVTSLQAPFGIIALCGPPVNQIVRRFKNFGWRSLLTSKQYTEPASQSSKQPGLVPQNESGSSLPRKNRSKGNVATSEASSLQKERDGEIIYYSASMPAFKKPESDVV